MGTVQLTQDMGPTRENGHPHPAGRACQRTKEFFGVYMARCGRRRFDLQRAGNGRRQRVAWSIIEADNTITVNNPNAIRAWQRASHWIGWISTPDVISYEEWDAVNAFYSGQAAFFVGGRYLTLLSVEAGANPAIRDAAKIGSSKIGITSVPGGTKQRQAVTLGGFWLSELPDRQFILSKQWSWSDSLFMKKCSSGGALASAA